MNEQSACLSVGCVVCTKLYGSRTEKDAIVGSSEQDLSSAVKHARWCHACWGGDYLCDWIILMQMPQNKPFSWLYFLLQGHGGMLHVSGEAQKAATFVFRQGRDLIGGKWGQRAEGAREDDVVEKPCHFAFGARSRVCVLIPGGVVSRIYAPTQAEARKGPALYGTICRPITSWGNMRGKEEKEYS